MSLRPSSGRPVICSGDMYESVPAAVPRSGSPVWVGAVSSIGADQRATPKSSTLTSPFSVSMTFEGLMSPCTIP